jgi:hypothetical protein
MLPMLIFTAEGRKSIDDRDVIAVYPGGGDGRYFYAVFMMDDGTEVSGAVEHGALPRIQEYSG